MDKTKKKKFFFEKIVQCINDSYAICALLFSVIKIHIILTIFSTIISFYNNRLLIVKKKKFDISTDFTV